MTQTSANRNQELAANPRTSVWVSASAGTGKTRILVNRILRLLLDGNRPERLLCITYTKSAAAEILERITHSAREWATTDDQKFYDSLQTLLGTRPTAEQQKTARALLPKILQTPGGMRIMTIHAFCQSVLARFPLESGINGSFEICDDLQSAELIYQAKQNLLSSLYREDNPALFDSLEFLYDRLNEASLDALLGALIKKRQKIDTIQENQKTLTQYRDLLCSYVGLDKKVTKENLNADLIRAIPNTARLQSYREALAKIGKSYPTQNADKIAAYIETPTIANYKKIFLTQANTISSRTISGVTEGNQPLLQFLIDESNRVFDYQQKLSAFDLVQSSYSLFVFHVFLLKEYQNLKRRQNLLDYEDQILLTERLLTKLADTQWVLYKLDAAIDHILLDEAQDTSPSQWNIVEKIAEEFFTGIGSQDEKIRTLFVVGDEKQSIFSFQNADPKSFSSMKEKMRQRASDADHPFEPLPLVKNYRSSSIILDFVDLVFKDIALKASITHDMGDLVHEAHHQSYGGTIDLWPLLPVGDDKNRNDYILANQIAIQVENMLGKPLDDGMPTQPGDVMILVRKRNPMVNPLVKAFKDRNIPVRSIDRLLLNEQLAVQDCLTALSVCLNPYDDYTLACFLKSPFIGMDEETLFDLAHKRGETRLWDVLQSNTRYQNIIGFYATMKDYGFENNPYQFMHRLLSLPCPNDARSGRHAVIKRLGYDADDILDQFMDVTAAYVDSHSATNQGFLTWIHHSQATTKAQSATGESTHVRIMTVHASKGLQAPIVFLADANSKPDGYKSVQDVLWSEEEDYFLWAKDPGNEHPLFDEQKSLHIKAGFYEFYRLLYVALTRAKEHLIICGTEQKIDKFKDYRSWYAVARDAMPQLPYEQSTVGKDIVRYTKKSAANTQSKDLQEIKKKIYTIDEALLKAPPAEPLPHYPLRPSQLPGKKQAVFSPLSTVTENTYRRGDILHRLFASISLYPNDEQEEMLRMLIDKYVDEPKFRNSYFKEVWSIISNPTYQALFSPLSRAEVPITGQITLNGTLYNVSGQIDRLLVENDRVLIVDFKTNRPASMTEAEVSDNYKFQLKAYRKVLQQVYPNKRIETAILWTSVPYLLNISG